MEVEGKIILDLPMQQGTSRAGNPWKKKEWVLETSGNFPRKVKFHIFGDKADTIRLEVGKQYVLSFDIESREFNGKWYTDISVYAAREATTQLPPDGGNNDMNSAGGNNFGPIPAFEPANEGDDLPF